MTVHHTHQTFWRSLHFIRPNDSDVGLPITRRFKQAILGLFLLACTLAVIGCQQETDSLNEEEISTGHFPAYDCGPSFEAPKHNMSDHFLHWTADGRWIVFDYPHRKLFDYDPRGGTGITAADVGGTHLRQIVEDANLGNLFNHGFYADVSPDNNRLAYASCQFPNTTSTYTRRRSPEVRIPNEGRHLRARKIPV